jgi:hypothetical protein
VVLTGCGWLKDITSHKKSYKIAWINLRLIVLFVETPHKFITAVINLRGVSTNKTIICFIAMQTYKELINLRLLNTVFKKNGKFTI